METSHHPASYTPQDFTRDISPTHRRILIGDLLFDRETGEVWAAGQAEPQRLRPRVAKLLSYLALHSGQLCSRSELQEVLWGDQAVDAEQGLNACVRDIRRQLGDEAARPKFLETLPGRGYRLIAAVAPAPAAQPGRGPAPRRTLLLCSALALVVVSMLGVRSAWAPPQLDPIDRQARALMREADYLAKSGDPDALRRSIELLQQALALEPAWALAHAELAQIHLVAGDPERARSLAALALALDPDLAEANAAAGFFAFYDHLDWAEADRLLERAIALDPTSSAARHAFAHVLSARGSHDRAQQQMQVAIELDPVDARLRGDACWVFYWARQFELAVGHAQKALDLAPRDAPARACLFSAQVAGGDLVAAAQQVEQVARWAGVPPGVRSRLGAQPAAQRVLAYWRYVGPEAAGQGGEGEMPAPSQQRLRAFSQLGMREAARLELARLSSEVAAADLLFLRLDPLLDPIRDLVPEPPS